MAAPPYTYSMALWVIPAVRVFDTVKLTTVQRPVDTFEYLRIWDGALVLATTGPVCKCYCKKYITDYICKSYNLVSLSYSIVT